MSISRSDSPVAPLQKSEHSKEIILALNDPYESDVAPLLR
jgi:hypothetical protein